MFEGNLIISDLDASFFYWSKFLEIFLKLSNRPVKGQMSNVNGVTFNCEWRVVNSEVHLNQTLYKQKRRPFNLKFHVMHMIKRHLHRKFRRKTMTKCIGPTQAHASPPPHTRTHTKHTHIRTRTHAPTPSFAMYLPLEQ